MVPCDVAYFGEETAAEVNPPKFGGLTRFRACPPAQNVLRVVISAAPFEFAFFQEKSLNMKLLFREVAG